MAMTSKIFLLVLIMDIMIFLSGINSSGNLLLFGPFLTVSATGNSTTGYSGNISYTGNVTNITGTVSPNPISNLVNFVVLPIYLILNTINLIFSILLGPAILLASIGAPFEVQLLIGSTLIILYFISFLEIIRGGDI